jgi:hypothetical protein
MTYLDAELWAWKDEQILLVLNSDADQKTVKAAIENILMADSVVTSDTSPPDTAR